MGGAARRPQEGPKRPFGAMISSGIELSGGAMVSILVQVFPPDHRPAQELGTVIDESIPKAVFKGLSDVKSQDMEIE